MATSFSRIAAVFSICAALGACGGGGSNTPGQTDENGLVTIGSVPGCPPSSACIASPGPDDWSSTGTNHVLAVATITNTAATAKHITLTGSLTWTFPNGIAVGNVIWGWMRRSTDPNIGSTAFPDYQHTIAAGEARKFDWAPAKSDTIAAGETVTYWLVAKESFFTAPVRYFNESIRADIAP